MRKTKLTILVALALISLMLVVLASIPDGYYANVSHSPKSYQDLRAAVGNGIDHPYEKDVFDCSEMAAYMEHKLENLGFNAWIREYEKGYVNHREYIDNREIDVGITRLSALRVVQRNDGKKNSQYFGRKQNAKADF